MTHVSTDLVYQPVNLLVKYPVSPLKHYMLFGEGKPACGNDDLRVKTRYMSLGLMYLKIEEISGCIHTSVNTRNYPWCGKRQDGIV